MNLKRTAAALLACAVWLSGFGVYAAPMSEEYEAYDRIAGYISELYIDDTLTSEEIVKNGLSKFLADNPDMLVPLLKSTFEELDDYSEFFTYEEYENYENSINKTFYGIGVLIQKNGDYVEITGFSEENGNAQRAGFQIGDKIFAVDGIECKGKSIDEVRNMIVGDLGTITDITVLRGTEKLNITARRVAVHQDTVTGGVFKGNIGYIKIVTFGNTTAEEFTAKLNEFRSKGVTQIIMDLRNNPGGLVTAAIDIAKQIVPRGKIIDLVCRNEKENVTYRSELRETEFEFLVLVNGNTASSSEILASAMQDSGAARLVGTNTYGKAVVQQIYPLTNGMKFKLTMGQYITRNGKEINHIGLVPDEVIDNTTKKIDSMQYNQFDFKTKFAIGDNDIKVVAAKERLSMLGYFSNKTDDPVFDEDLRNAVAAFQASNNLCASGVLDIPTQVRLENMFEKLETTVDLQLQYAYKMFGGNPEDLYAE